MPAKRTGTRRGVRTVRIDDRQLKELLDRMDEVRNPEVEEKRQHTRYTYRNQKLTVHIRQPGSGDVRGVRSGATETSAPGGRRSCTAATCTTARSACWS